MSINGEPSDLLVRARAALLEALIALEGHHNSVVVIGAQAIYLHTGAAPVAVAEATKDSDLAIDARTLAEAPLIEQAMTSARFVPDPQANQPGAWLSPTGIPVDLLVPEAIAGGRRRRSVILPPHDKRAMRRTRGLEAAVVDNEVMVVRPLSPADSRRASARVAGPAALLVSKLHKIAERRDNPKRLVDKDAHDIYRLLVATSTAEVATTFHRLLGDDLASEVTQQAQGYLNDLFAVGPTALGCQMAGRTEEGVGDPDVVAQSCALLAMDLINAVENR